MAARGSRRVPVSPSRQVEVLYRGSWLRGWLSVWRKDDVGWLAYVTFSYPDGVTQPRWFDQDHIAAAAYSLATGPLEGAQLSQGQTPILPRPFRL